MDLLLTHGYFLYEDPKELQIMKPYVPLGILYLTSHLASLQTSKSKFSTPRFLREGIAAASRKRGAGGPWCLRQSHDAEQCAADSQGGEGCRMENRRRRS